MTTTLFHSPSLPGPSQGPLPDDDCFITGSRRPCPQDYADSYIREFCFSQAFTAKNDIEMTFFIIKAHLSGSLQQRQEILMNEVNRYLQENLGFNIFSDYFDRRPSLSGPEQTRKWSKTSILLYGVDLLNQTQIQELLKQRYPQHTIWPHKLVSLSHSCCKIVYEQIEPTDLILSQMKADEVATSSEDEWMQIKPYSVFGATRNLFVRRALRQEVFPEMDKKWKFNDFSEIVGNIAKYLLAKFKAIDSYRTIKIQINFQQYSSSLGDNLRNKSILSTLRIKENQQKIYQFSQQTALKDHFEPIQIEQDILKDKPQQNQIVQEIQQHFENLPLEEPQQFQSQIQQPCQKNIEQPEKDGALSNMNDSFGLEKSQDEVKQLFKDCKKRKAIKKAQRECMDVSEQDSPDLPEAEKIAYRKRKLIIKKGYLPFRDEHSSIEVSNIVASSEPLKPEKPKQFLHSESEVQYLDFAPNKMKTHPHLNLHPLPQIEVLQSVEKKGPKNNCPSADASNVIDLVSDDVSQDEPIREIPILNVRQLERQNKVWSWYRKGLSNIDTETLECNIWSSSRKRQ